MNHIGNPGEFERRLKEKSASFAQVLACRAALRIVPLLEFSLNEENSESAVFRALFISWVAGKWPDLNIGYPALWAADYVKLCVNGANFASSLAEATYNAYKNAPSRPVYIENTITHAANTVFYTFHRVINFAQEKQLDGHTSNPSNANSTVYDIPRNALWPSIEADMIRIDENTHHNSSYEPSLLMPLQLWPDIYAGDKIIREWPYFKAKLEAQDGDWSIWADWYQGRLDGKTSAFPGLSPEVDERFCIALANEDRGFWERDAGIVNLDIKSRLDNLRSSSEFEISGKPNSSLIALELEGEINGLERKDKFSRKAISVAKKSRTKKIVAKTVIGKAALTNQVQIDLQSSVITNLITDRINTLQGECPNSEEAITARDAEIAELGVWHNIISDIKTQTEGFVSGKTEEKELGSVANALKAMLIEYIQKNGKEALGITVKGSIVGLAMVLGHLCGLPGLIGVTAISAITGGKVVVDALKAVRGIVPRAKP